MRAGGVRGVEGGLRKSASVPSGLRPRARDPASPPRGRKGPAQPLESRLLVAWPAEQGGTSTWEPFHFKHHADGSISFRPAGHGDEAGRGPELLLNADWERPWAAAAWQTLDFDDGAPAGASRTALPRGGGGEGRLHPFSLSYAPLCGRPGEEEPLLAPRRTLMLAARDGRTRDRWLKSLSRRARLCGPAGAPAPRAATAAAAAAQRQSRSRGGAAAASLGDALPRLPQAARSCPEGFAASASAAEPLSALAASAGPRRRLLAADGDLWASHSSFAVVRDLYDGYAADPLAAQASAPGGAAGPDGFLGGYLDRQAEIEGLLEQRLARATLPSAALLPALPTPPLPGGGGAGAPPQRAPAPPAAARAAEAASLAGAGPRPPRLAFKTPNVRLDGDTLENAEWSGGVIFAPQDELNFRLTIVPMDDLETHPLFLGIAPADADLSMVNFFDAGGGVFLSMGGSSNYTLLSACGAPGGPCFHAGAARSVSVLPLLVPGYTLSVAFEATGPSPRAPPEGRVHFAVGDRRGEALFYDRPRLPRSLPARGWRPCLLLSRPGTRVRVLP